MSDWTPPDHTAEPDPAMLAAIEGRLGAIRGRNAIAKYLLGEDWDHFPDDTMRDRDVLLDLVEAIQKQMASFWRVAAMNRKRAELWRGTGDPRAAWCAAQAYANAAVAEQLEEAFGDALDLWWRLDWRRIADALTAEGFPE